MDEKRLAEIEARANAATPGPWEPEHRGVVGNDVFIVEDCVTAGWDAYRANQAFIATARTDVPDLVAEVRRLTAALATVTAEHAAALDAARREGAEGMRAAAVAMIGRRITAWDDDADECGDEDAATRWEEATAIRDAIRALPLDAPGGGS